MIAHGNFSRNRWCIWIGGLFLFLAGERQGGAKTNCADAGFYAVPCGDFQVQRSRTLDGVRELSLRSASGGFVVFQSVPFSYFPDRKGSLKQVITFYRNKFSPVRGAPYEQWFVFKGMRFYQFLFRPNLVLWMTPTKGGYIVVLATWKVQGEPLLKHIELAAFEAVPIRENIQLPHPSVQTNVSGVGGWICYAQGSVRHCRRHRGAYYTPCSTRTAFGGGRGVNQRAAGVSAIRSCISRRTQLFVLGNFPSGSSRYSNFSQQGAACRVTRCSRVR